MGFRTISCFILASYLAILGACGGASPNAASAATPKHAESHQEHGVLATTGDDAPPHVFEPRVSARRVHPMPPAPPPLDRLPPMVNRIQQCFAAPIPYYGPGIPLGSATMGHGAGGGQGRGVAKPKTTARARNAPGAFGSGAGAPASAAPAPMPSAVPMPPAPQKAETLAAAQPKKDVARDEKRPADYVQAEDEASGDRVEEPKGYDDWGASIYLSNDDTMSLSSAQRVLFAIDQFLPLPVEQIRPHEMLNYFSFDTARVPNDRDFAVRADIAPDKERPGVYTLAMAVSGRPMDVRARRNANLALVVDRSGSMQDEGRMEYLKRGLSRMVSELKTGDIVSLVAFDHEVCVPVENFVVGRDPMPVLTDAISRLSPRGSTDLNSGLVAGYQIADRSYQPTYTNRVVLITDALANTGVTDEGLISEVGRYYDARRIRLSGVGVGREFNDSLLDRLTERGRGAYVFLGSPAEVDAVFGERFISLIETTALDVHFRLHLPPSLKMNVFYGEESSTVKEDVQAIHYFANTSQLFLSDLVAKGGKLRPQDSVMLTVEYEHPETGEKMFEEYAFPLGGILRNAPNVQKGRLVIRFVDGLAEIASRPLPSRYGAAAAAWDDGDAYQRCEVGREKLSSMSRGIDGDPEVRRVLGLWERFCSRYEIPRQPVRRTVTQRSWPGAVQETNGN